MARVLYLDDDKELVFLLSRALGKRGHAVTAFTDPAAALQAFGEQPHDFDLILTDMSMPGLSGLEFAQKILKIEPQADVIIASGCDDPNWANRARACGVRDVVEKPGTIDALAEVIERLLASQQQREEWS
ncbi:MAG: hypothetical protein JWN85_214 [Gammaproteobacteria bacterium]|nr:hypothetical protein [Gammaproteobacteria bacterium]